MNTLKLIPILLIISSYANLTGQSSIEDADVDTSIDVEQGTDPDNILFEVGRTQYFRMTKRTSECINNNRSVFIGEGEDITNGDQNVTVGEKAMKTCNQAIKQQQQQINVLTEEISSIRSQMNE